MWELKKSRIRLRASGRAVKREGREVGEARTIISIAVTLPHISRMIKDIIMLYKSLDIFFEAPKGNRSENPVLLIALSNFTQLHHKT
jgi:hypothetical protein